MGWFEREEGILGRGWIRGGSEKGEYGGKIVLIVVGLV